jgi:hypothetical protein
VAIASGYTMNTSPGPATATLQPEHSDIHSACAVVQFIC